MCTKEDDQCNQLKESEKITKISVRYIDFLEASAVQLSYNQSLRSQLLYIYIYKTPTGQLRQSDNICNMAFLPKGINNRESFGSVLAQGTLLS